VIAGIGLAANGAIDTSPDQSGGELGIEQQVVDP
jgi:hypothetical protein